MFIICWWSYIIANDDDNWIKKSLLVHAFWDDLLEGEFNHFSSQLVAVVGLSGLTVQLFLYDFHHIAVTLELNPSVFQFIGVHCLNLLQLSDAIIRLPRQSVSHENENYQRVFYIPSRYLCSHFERRIKISASCF